MPTIRELRNRAAKYSDGKSEKIANYQTAKMIWKQLRRAEYESRSFSKKLVPIFKSDDDLKTCKKVWYFLRHYLQYDKEPKENQTAKTIARYIVSQKGDCKHYATASVGICLACGIPAWFSFVRQSKKNPNKGHIYCSAFVDGKIIVIDPCRKKFNSECQYIFKKNIPPIDK